MAKKQKCPEFENHERWLVSYADMVTLLFAVFVVLYALSISGSQSKEDQIVGSIQESFNVPMEDIPVNRRVGPNESGWGVFENYHGDQIRPPLIEKFPAAKTSIHLLETEMNKTKANIEDRLYGNQKFREQTAPGAERIVSVHRTDRGFAVRLLARHFYDPGASTIKRSAMRELDSVTEILKELGRPITVEGHTDSTPPAGDLTNWELSAMRAGNIARYMVRNHNFPVSLLSVAGYADTKPIAHNGTEEGRNLNRRIEIQVHYDSPYNSEPPQSGP